MKFSTDDYFDGIISGNKRILGKAITLIESKKAEHREQAEELLQKIMPYSGNSVRVGISGIPGAGKSTFIENFGKLAIDKGKKVAVLAIDPSSSVNHGSILGDKTRMEDLAKHEKAFIRPSPSSGFLGGVANTTFETMLLCEAAAFDLILIETVGVGQSEILVDDISDVFLFIKLTGGGDELQGIKRGIMEVADIIFINKVSEENLSSAKLTKLELQRALHFLAPKPDGRKVPVLLGSALENRGLDQVYEEIFSLIQFRNEKGFFNVRRKLQAEKRFDYWVREYIVQKSQLQNVDSGYASFKKNASELLGNPSSEARKFVEKAFNKTILP